MAAHGKEDSTPELQRELEGRCDRFEFREVLSALNEPELGGALPKPIVLLLRGRALAGIEQFHEAYDLFSEVRRERDISAALRIESQFRSARVLRHASPLVDFALELSLAAAEAGARSSARARGYAVFAHLEAAQLFARKRCPQLAYEQVDKARALELEAPFVHVAEAELALSFDERVRARQALELAASTNEPAGLRVARLGLVRLFTLMGEFDAAAECLAKLSPAAPLDIPVLRARYRLASSQARWHDVASVLAEIISAAPQGDYTRGLQYERGAALYRAGQIEPARAAWRELAEGKHYYGGLARRMLEKTGNAQAAAKRLSAFPSVSQLRNHCGPASVELCLRFFGTAANQVDVAREIKHPDGGTPVHRMRWYMDRSGFATRRIEADLPRLKGIIDAGIPVILEEDYSTSRHVAVAVGYDDRRELLEVQDPMTHEIRETFYEDLPKLREFSNYGALVAFPLGRQDLAKQLDDLGAIECAYISKTDQAWQAKDEGKFEEADRLADEAIALHEPYELSWVYRFVRARMIARNETDEAKLPAARQQLQAVLDRILELWPNDEWPQQYLGQVLDFEGQTSEALAAFERARDRDPDDSDNHCSIGDCLLALGRRDDAKKAFESALERDPAHVRSNENLSDFLLDSGDVSRARILNSCALELAPKNPFNHGVCGRIAARRGEHAAAAAAFGRALELVPGRPYYVIERARALANAGRVDEAMANLSALCDARPDDAGALVPWADIAYSHARIADSLEACARLEKLDPEHPSSYAIAGAARCQNGELEAGIGALRRALHLSPTYAWAQRELGKHLAIAKRHDEAIVAYAANAGIAPDVRATFLLGSALADAGHHSPALRYFRKVADSGELSERELGRVAASMRIVNGVGDTHAYFQNLTANNPRDTAMHAAHVHFLVDELWYPGAATSVIAKLSELDPDSPFVLAKEGDDLMDASLEAELRGEELLRMAMAKAPALVYPRRLLVRQLNARGRFDEAVALLGSAKLDQETTQDRVDALLGLEREADARQAIESYVATLSEDEREAARRPLLFRLAQIARRHEEALEHARFVSKQKGDMPDDGQLSPWEKKQFSCLVALGSSEEAFSFGQAQCNDAEDRGDLAYAAWQEGDNALATRFAEAALAEDESEVSALHVMAKQAEIAGDEARALALWERMIAVTGWHIHVENIARLALAQGDLERAKLNAEKAVATGHTCYVALQVRAEVRLLSGDREGARLDAERALACTPLEWRSRSHETRALLSALAGRSDEARRGYDAYQSQEQLTPSNRARLTRVLGALGLQT